MAPSARYFDDQVLVRLTQYADSKPKVEEPKERLWSVRDGQPIPNMIDAPERDEPDWNDSKYDAIFGPRE